MVPNPNDATCASYVHCNNGVAHVMSCQSGLLFNPTCSCCDWPNNVDCNGGGGGTPPPPPVTAGPTVAPPPSPPTAAPTPPPPPGPGGKKFVCYYPNWAYWRQGDGNFKGPSINDSRMFYTLPLV